MNAPRLNVEGLFRELAIAIKTKIAATALPTKPDRNAKPTSRFFIGRGLGMKSRAAIVIDHYFAFQIVRYGNKESKFNAVVKVSRALRYSPDKIAINHEFNWKNHTILRSGAAASIPFI